MLEFYDNNKIVGYVSIYSSYITFSKSLAEVLDKAYRVRTAVDKEEKKIYFFLLSKDAACDATLDTDSLFKVSVSKTYARICSKKLIDFFCILLGLEIEKNKYIRVLANYNKEEESVEVKLSEVN